MKIHDIRESFTEYYKTGLLIATPFCTDKCSKDLGLEVSLCHNCLIENEYEEISNKDILQRYKDGQGLFKSLIFAGREPMDSFEELVELIRDFRELYNDDIVIYTGFYKNEIFSKLAIIKMFENIVVKFGRFIPNQEKVYDNILQVYLANKEQYVEKIS